MKEVIKKGLKQTKIVELKNIVPNLKTHWIYSIVKMTEVRNSELQATTCGTIIKKNSTFLLFQLQQGPEKHCRAERAFEK